MAETKPTFNTPHLVDKPGSTYVGYNPKILQEIDTQGSAMLGEHRLDRHINTPGALVPDARYVDNKSLSEARKDAVHWTAEVAKAEGGKLAEGIKESYAASMAKLRNVHHEILPKLPFDADQLARSDIGKVIEIAAHKVGKKVTVVAGFLASSASFAGEAIDVSGKILTGEEAKTEKLKALGSVVVDKGLEGAMGVVDPLGLIDTKEMSKQLQHGNAETVIAAFNEARLKAASDIADVAIEHSR